MILLLILFMGISTGVRADKHVLVAYDISKSMDVNWNKDQINRINGYLTKLLFDGLGKIDQGDMVISIKEGPFLDKEVPLLKQGDRLSFLKFGSPPIPSPELSKIYSQEFPLRREITRRLPERRDQLRESWTCIELLHYKASVAFKEHSQLKPYLLVLISDKSESRYPLSLDDQRHILEYKQRYRQDLLLDLQVGRVHLELSEVIPPASGIKILKPEPWQAYSAGESILLSVQLMNEGEVLKEKGWEVAADVTLKGKKKKVILNDKGLGKDEKADDGLWTGTFLSRKGGPLKILIKAAKNGLDGFESEQMQLTLLSPAGPPIWFIIIMAILLGLGLWHWLWPLRLWIERQGAGMAPRRVKLKGVGDILFLGKREDEAYIDLGLPKYSILRQKRREIALWCEAREKGEVVPFGKWFSLPDDEETALRFSFNRPKREEVRRQEIRPQQKVEGEDFYKL